MNTTTQTYLLSVIRRLAGKYQFPAAEGIELIMGSGFMKPMFNNIFADGTLREYIEANITDPWENTPFEGYAFMNPKQKGEFGERFATKLLQQAGHKVERAHSSTAGYDRIVNGKKVEIKFSLANRDKVHGGVKKDVFILNHVSMAKDWERLLFIGVNAEEADIRLVWFTRLDFTNHIIMAGDGKRCFNLQQGGKKVKNDDWMCTKIPALMAQDWVHSGIDDWGTGGFVKCDYCEFKGKPHEEIYFQDGGNIKSCADHLDRPRTVPNPHKFSVCKHCHQNLLTKFFPSDDAPTCFNCIENFDGWGSDDDDLTNMGAYQ
jgi:hypothetical protein